MSLERASLPRFRVGQTVAIGPNTYSCPEGLATVTWVFSDFYDTAGRRYRVEQDGMLYYAWDAFMRPTAEYQFDSYCCVVKKAPPTNRPACRETVLLNARPRQARAYYRYERQGGMGRSRARLLTIGHYVMPLEEM